MSTPQPASRDDSPPPFIARKFDLSKVEGLSKRAIDVHLGLYEGYVKECNALQPLLASASGDNTGARLQLDGLARRFAFERNGMELHEIFFEPLRGKSGPPTDKGAFAEAAKAGYGSFDAWRANAVKLAQTRGIGWVLTVLAPREHRLTNVWIDDHTRGLMANSRIVFALDLWEHAYLIDYQPAQKPQYLTVLFDNIDWTVVDSRCQ